MKNQYLQQTQTLFPFVCMPEGMLPYTELSTVVVPIPLNSQLGWTAEPQEYNMEASGTFY